MDKLRDLPEILISEAFFASVEKQFRNRLWKQVKRKIQGVPQSQVAANPRHQEEEERDINQHAQNKQTHEKHTYQQEIAILKGLKTQG